MKNKIDWENDIETIKDTYTDKWGKNHFYQEAGKWVVDENKKTKDRDHTFQVLTLDILLSKS